MDWKYAKSWLVTANDEKSEMGPKWNWDCGFKLDFDGELISISSRFYQIDDKIFDGSVGFYIGDNKIYEQEFMSRHIDNLKASVEKYVNDVKSNLNKLIQDNMIIFLNENE